MQWIKSSYSNGDGGDCVEWSPSSVVNSAAVPVRDSKDPEGPVLFFGVAAWNGFVAGVKAGDFPVC